MKVIVCIFWVVISCIEIYFFVWVECFLEMKYGLCSIVVIGIELSCFWKKKKKKLKGKSKDCVIGVIIVKFLI